MLSIINLASWSQVPPIARVWRELWGRELSAMCTTPTTTPPPSWCWQVWGTWPLVLKQWGVPCGQTSSSMCAQLQPELDKSGSMSSHLWLASAIAPGNLHPPGPRARPLHLGFLPHPPNHADASSSAPPYTLAAPRPPGPAGVGNCPQRHEWHCELAAQTAGRWQ